MATTAAAVPTTESAPWHICSREGNSHDPVQLARPRIPPSAGQEDRSNRWSLEVLRTREIYVRLQPARTIGGEDSSLSLRARQDHQPRYQRRGEDAGRESRRGHPGTRHGNLLGG